MSTDNFYEACLLDCTDTSWSVLFLTLNHLALIIAEQPQKRSSNRPPIRVKWIYDTKDIRYVDIVDETSLTIGFLTCSITLPLGDTLVTERVRYKVDKIMRYM